MSKISRRNLFQIGATGAGTLIVSKALGNTCKGVTGPQGLGPFFPNRGTPAMEVDESGGSISEPALANDNDLTFVSGKNGGAEGQIVEIKGAITNEACEPVKNAEVIIWQASHTGKYNHLRDDANTSFVDPFTGKIAKRKLDPNFQYWGRSHTNNKGEYLFKTIVPGHYPAFVDKNDPTKSWYRPPHIHFMVSAMGYPQFVTQMYFAGAAISGSKNIAQLNQKDSLLQDQRLTDKQRQGLVVKFVNTAIGAVPTGQFNIILKR